MSSDSRIHRSTQQLELVIRYSIEEGYITRSPFNRNVKRPQGIKRDPRHTAFTLGEVEFLLGEIQKSRSDMMKTIVPAILLSGLRINEFLALKYSDLNRETGTIFIHDAVHSTYDEDTGEKVGHELGETKTKASVREIPVPPMFFDIIDNWHDFVYKSSRRIRGIEKEGTADIIFTGIDGKIRNDATTRSRCAGYLKKWGLKKPNTTFHGFRRTYATLMHEAKVDMETISLLLGHKHEVKDGCNVAREHYVWVRDEAIQENMKEAVKKFYDHVGKVFEENITLNHVKMNEHGKTE